MVVVVNTRVLLLAAVLTFLVAFNLFKIFPPISSSSLSIDIEFGESQSRPYVVRVKVEKMSTVDTVPSPVARATVSFNEFVSITNLNGYAVFTATPGKHVVTVSSPRSLFPTFSTEIEVTTRVTELVVRFVEHRFKPETVNILLDAASQTSFVTFTYLQPANITLYVGQPYITFVNLESFVKRFSGEDIIPYMPDAAIQYSGPFTQTTAVEQPSLSTTTTAVQDMIMYVVLDESFVIAYSVEATLLKME